MADADFTIFSLPQTEEDAVALSQRHNLIPETKTCENSHPMRLNLKEYMWRCPIRSCQKKATARSGSWLQGLRLSFLTLLQFIYAWAEELTTIKFCQRHIKISQSTTVALNNLMREACTVDLLAQPQQKIGGPGKIVEVDETLFVQRKSHVGRVLPQQWLFGGICRETGGCFIVPVPSRNATTLMAAIELHIQPGTTIFSDCWRAYNSKQLEAAGYHHAQVNHRYNFVDPSTGVHTQNIERMWGSCKWRNKRHRGTARQCLDSHLNEFMWRKTVGANNTFTRILYALTLLPAKVGDTADDAAASTSAD